MVTDGKFLKQTYSLTHSHTPKSRYAIASEKVFQQALGRRNMKLSVTIAEPKYNCLSCFDVPLFSTFGDI